MIPYNKPLKVIFLFYISKLQNRPDGALLTKTKNEYAEE